MSDRRRELLAGALLVGMGAFGLLMAISAAAKRYGPTLHIHHALPNELRGPLHSIDLGLGGTEFALLFIGLGLCYLGVVWLSDAISLRAAVIAIVALHVIFLIAPPLLSSDIFNYVGYSRLQVVHGLNPYVHSLAAAPTDPSYIYVGWPLNTTAYGPLFTVISLPLSWLEFPAAIWGMKLLATVASLGCVWLLWLCATRRGRPAIPAILYFGLNPVLLAYAVGGGHNDTLMLFAALIGIYLLLTERESGMAALVTAAAVKSSAIILAPFALIGSRRPWRALAWGAGAAVVFGVMTLAVFGSHVKSLLHVLQHDARLETANDVPGAINDLLGLGITTQTLGRIGMYLLVVAMVVLLVRTFRGGDWLENSGWAVFALLVTTTWFLPWYLIWFLPIAALTLRPYQRFAGLALTALAIGLQLPLIFGK